MKEIAFTKSISNVFQCPVKSSLLKSICALPLFLAIFMVGCKKDSSNPILAKPATALTLSGVSNSPAPIDLGTAGNFTVLTETGISTTGVTAITGDMGVSPISSTAITGFGLTKDPSNQYSTSPVVTGKVYASDYAAPTPTKMTTAVADMKTAFTNANGLTTPAPIVNLYAGDVSGKTLPAGLYKWTTGLLVTSVGVTLNGSASDVWVFQIAKNLVISNSAIIHLSGGAQASNVFWVVSGKATLGTGVDFSGNILSKTLISLNTGATVNGRLFAQTAVTFIANTVTPGGQVTASPGSGIVYSAVTINGSNFSTTAANNVVKINGLTAVVSSATATQIIATVPLGATTGKITVTANGQTSTSALDFNVLQMIGEGSKTLPANLNIASMAGDKNGNLYGTASGIGTDGNATNFIFKYSSSGSVSHLYDSPAGSSTLGEYTLTNLVVDSKGNIDVAQNYALDGNAAASKTKILKITSAGQVSTITGGNPGIVNSSGSDTREYTNIYSIIIDAQDNLYAATVNEMKEITPQGVVTTVAGFNPEAAKFMAKDKAGDLYYWSRAVVNGIANYSVKKVTQQGVISTIFTNTSSILAIITDAANNVFVSVGGRVNKVYIINRAGVINNLTFSDNANTFLTDNNGNFYTIAKSISLYNFK